MIFKKPSSRTRVSFEIGMFQMGGLALFLNDHDLGMGVRESVADIGRLFSRYLDGIVIRTFAHEEVVTGAVRHDSGDQWFDRFAPSLSNPRRPPDHPGEIRPLRGGETDLGGRWQ